MFNKTLVAVMLTLSSGAVLADDALPFLDENSLVPSLRDSVLQDQSLSFERPSFTTSLGLGLGQSFFVQGNFANLDNLEAQRDPRFIDDFSLEIEKYSMGFGFRRALTERLDVNATVDVVHLDYASGFAPVAELDTDTGKSVGLGFTGKASDALEVGAQWSVTRYDSDPLQREFNAVDIRATYKFTPNFGLFTQYGVSDDLNGDGQLEDQYRVGGRLSF